MRITVPVTDFKPYTYDQIRDVKVGDKMIDQFGLEYTIQAIVAVEYEEDVAILRYTNYHGKLAYCLARTFHLASGYMPLST